MAAESWDSSSAVTAQDKWKRRYGPSFGIFARCWMKSRSGCISFRLCACFREMEQDRKPVGYFITPQGETIRFSARTSLAFPPSEIYDLRRMENGQMSMTVEFMGLCAAISVMPAPYTEFLHCASSAEGSCDGRFSEYLQPSHDFILLQRLGKVSLFHRIRKNQERIGFPTACSICWVLALRACAVEAEFRMTHI